MGDVGKSVYFFKHSHLPTSDEAELETCYIKQTFPSRLWATLESQFIFLTIHTFQLPPKRNWKRVKKLIIMEYGKFYHVFNRGNNYQNIFTIKPDYIHFLELYKIYIEPIAETFAWCLMKNHFHALIRIKNESEIGYLNSEFAYSKDLYKKWKTYPLKKDNKKFTIKPKPDNQFRHFFNAYARWYNLLHKRQDALFAKNFKTKTINHHKYLSNVIVYINNNPVHHEFVSHPSEYSWSSYLSILSLNPTKLRRKTVIGYFDTVGNFKTQHSNPQDYNIIKDYIIE